MLFLLLQIRRQMQEQRIPTARSMQSKTMPLPHLAFKKALLKSFNLEFGGHKPPIPLHGLATNLFLLQTPMVQFVWAHCQTHELEFGKNVKYEMMFILLLPEIKLTICEKNQTNFY